MIIFFEVVDLGTLSPQAFSLFVGIFKGLILKILFASLKSKNVNSITYNTANWKLEK